MKKSYMKPAGRLISMQVNENIATSENPLDINKVGFTMYYSYNEVGTKFIHNSTVPASDTGNADFDAFYDLVASYTYNVSSICRSV